jgi:tetratricopeptide (TPR) repeat protein
VKKKAIEGILAIIMVLGCVAVLSAAALNPRTYWEKGLEAAESKLYLDAIDYYTRAIRTNKGEIGIEDVAKIFRDRGVAHMNLRQYDEAASDFSNAMMLDQSNISFYSDRGLAYYYLKQFDQASDDFSKAIARNPRNVSAYSYRGMVFMEAKNYDRAIQDYSKAIEIDPKNATAYYNRGLAYKYEGLNDKALQNFDKVLEIAPKDHSAGYQKAAIYALLGKIDVACTWLEIAVENGYNDWAAIKNSPDFDRIRKTDCYRKIMAGK